MNTAKVRIVYVGRIRAGAGCKEEVLEVDQRTGVRQILEKLAKDHGPEFRQMVFDDGDLRLGLNILVDGVNVTGQVLTREVDQAATVPNGEASETEIELVLLEAPPSGG